MTGTTGILPFWLSGEINDPPTAFAAEADAPRRGVRRDAARRPAQARGAPRHWPRPAASG